MVLIFLFSGYSELWLVIVLMWKVWLFLFWVFSVIGRILICGLMLFSCNDVCRCLRVCGMVLMVIILLLGLMVCVVVMVCRLMFVLVLMNMLLVFSVCLMNRCRLCFILLLLSRYMVSRLLFLL